MIIREKKKEKKRSLGLLTGPVGGACNTWSEGYEFKPHIACGDSLKIKPWGPPGWYSQLSAQILVLA